MATTTRKAASAEEVARGYFGALERMDRQAQRDWYHDESGAQFHGGDRLGSKAEVIEYFDALYNAFPDFRLGIVEVTAQDDRAVVQWRGSAPLAGPRPLPGNEAPGPRIDTPRGHLLRARGGQGALV